MNRKKISFEPILTPSRRHMLYGNGLELPEMKGDISFSICTSKGLDILLYLRIDGVLKGWKFGLERTFHTSDQYYQYSDRDYRPAVSEISRRWVLQAVGRLARSEITDEERAELKAMHDEQKAKDEAFQKQMAEQKAEQEKAELERLKAKYE